MNVSNHQTLLDSEGHKIGVLIPYTEYEEIMQLFLKYTEYTEMEASLKRALEEVEQIKSGKMPRKSLISFLDEL